MEARNLTLREASIAAVGMVVLSALFCGPHLLLDPDLAPFDNGDSVGSYFPYFARTYQPLSPQIAGDWDPTLWTGLPESHSPFGRYYPPAWLLFVLFPLGLALSLTYVVHHALAGLGAYLLMRTQGFRPASAWLAGMVFAFEPNACIGNHRVNIGGTVIVTSTGCEELNHIPTSVTHKQ